MVHIMNVYEAVMSGRNLEEKGHEDNNVLTVALSTQEAKPHPFNRLIPQPRYGFILRSCLDESQK